RLCGGGDHGQNRTRPRRGRTRPRPRRRRERPGSNPSGRRRCVPVRTVVLAGGTGGAKLASGFQSRLEPGELTVIANTADDDEFWGLLVSPDVDATIYRLAGVFDDAAGYGQKGDTFNTLEALGGIGEPTWFRIGDRDLATHVLRADMLNKGCRLTETALELCQRFGLTARVLPMTDEKGRTG